MKTLCPPKLPKIEDRKYHIECQNRECGAILEMGHGEMSHHDSQLDGEFSQFICPHCNRQTTVYNLKLSLVPTQ